MRGTDILILNVTRSFQPNTSNHQCLHENGTAVSILLVQAAAKGYLLNCTVLVEYRPYAIPNVKQIVDGSPDTTPPF